MPEVRMPKMGDSMEEGTILRWMKHEGDAVAAEEPIAEVETDKANVEITAYETGPLTKIVAQEGQTVAVGAVIAIIGTAEGLTALHMDEVKADLSVIPTPSSEPGAPSSAQAPELTVSSRIKASPLARRMARQMRLDLSQIAGTGPNGRIIERDIETLVEKHAEAAPASSRSPIIGRGAAGAVPAEPGLAGQDTDISKMRRAIARRTVQSKQTVPHFYLTMPVEMDRAMDMLVQMNEQTPKRKVTVNDLIVKACALALAAFPDVNVSFTPEEKIRRYDKTNIGVAVGTDDGLRIPILTDCAGKALRQLSEEMKALAAKARGGTLLPQEMSGGTFTVSNLGMFGIEEFGAIINPPESAILAVGAVMPEVMVADNGSFVARRRMRMTLSCDHRAVDGLLGAKFLQEVRRLLESPVNLLT